MPRPESGIELFATLRDQLIATQDPRDAERAKIIGAILEARGSELIYNPQGRLTDLEEGRTWIAIGVGPKPDPLGEQVSEDQQHPSPSIPEDPLIKALQELKLGVFKPYCKEPGELEACRKLMSGQDMEGWEVWTVLRIMQTNAIPVFFVPASDLMR